MKMNARNTFSCYPSEMMIYHPAQSGLPKMLNVSSDTMIGNGSGFGTDVVYSSYGEFLERHHFYQNVKVDRVGTLSSVMNSTEKNKWYAAISHMSKLSNVADHKFSLTQVKLLDTYSINFIPTTVISLSPQLFQDRCYFPFIDSSGQAGHEDPNIAIQNALNEFIERQALIGSWLSGKTLYQIKLSEHEQLSDLNNTLKKLLQHGELYAFQLGVGLPQYNILLMYFSYHSFDVVQYSVGMASHSSPLIAMKKALNELWQSYIFMYFNANSSENLDDRYQYLNQLIHFNCSDTKDIVPFLKSTQSLIDMNQYLSQKCFRYEKTIEQLKSISPLLYIYKKEQQFFKKKMYYVKIISPDFYLHMGITRPLNFDNAYSRLLGIETINTITVPIPFP